MTTYLLMYDLNGEESSAAYKPLIDELKRLDCHKFQFSSWLISANNTAKEIRTHFSQYLDDDDSIFVAELVDNHNHNKSKAGTTAWIAEHPPSR